MRTPKTIAAAALAAALAGGALVGATLGNPLASGASGNASATTTTTTPGTAGMPGPKGDHKGPRGPMDLDVAAKTLKLTPEELRTQLQSGKSLATIAKAQGVDKQTLIDALVKAGEARLDEAKKALPDMVATMVDATPPKGGGGMGPGGMGPGGKGPGRRAPGLTAAAKALGITEDDLVQAFRDGKTIADVAKSKGVDEQKVIDAMVTEAKTKTAQAVKDGTITQEQADQRLKDLEQHISDFVNGTFPKGPMGPGGGPDGPDGPPQGGTGGN